MRGVFSSRGRSAAAAATRRRMVARRHKSSHRCAARSCDERCAHATPTFPASIPTHAPKETHPSLRSRSVDCPTYDMKRPRRPPCSLPRSLRANARGPEGPRAPPWRRLMKSAVISPVADGLPRMRAGMSKCFRKLLFGCICCFPRSYLVLISLVCRYVFLRHVSNFFF